MDILDEVADFTWGFGNQFFLETKQGNFVWSDPAYNGDNTLTKVEMTYKKWCTAIGIPYGRCKGTHVIRSYCGSDIRIV